MNIKGELPNTLVKKGDKLFGVDEWSTLSEGFLDRTLSLEIDSEGEVACISLKEFPGCCGMCILTELSSASYSTKCYRKKGYGSFLTEAALHWAATEGYTVVMATTLSNNKATTKICKALGATQVTTFINRRTKNKLIVWLVKLPNQVNI